MLESIRRKARLVAQLADDANASPLLGLKIGICLLDVLAAFELGWACVELIRFMISGYFDDAFGLAYDNQDLLAMILSTVVFAFMAASGAALAVMTWRRDDPDMVETNALVFIIWAAILLVCGLAVHASVLTAVVATVPNLAGSAVCASLTTLLRQETARKRSQTDDATEIEEARTPYDTTESPLAPTPQHVVLPVRQETA